MSGLRFLTILTSLAILSGCATEQDYFIKDSFPYEEVCLVDNKNVPASFFFYLKKALIDKGLNIHTVSSVDMKSKTCSAYVFYEAEYKKKAAQNYLASAKILLFSQKEGLLSVEMKKNRDAPDSLLDEMIDPEPTVRRLVNRLLPRNSPW